MSYRMILRDNYAKERFIRVVRQAPPDHVGIVEEVGRTNDQNKKMQAMLSDVAIACPRGRKLLPHQWKALFMDALEKETSNAAYGSRWEPGLDGNGVVNLGYRSSRLKKSEMGDLIAFIEAWGSQNGVRWSDVPKDEPQGKAAA